MKKSAIIIVLCVILATYLGIFHPEHTYLSEENLWFWSKSTYVLIVFIISIDLFIVAFLLLYLLVKKRGLSKNTAGPFSVLIGVIAVITTFISIFYLFME